MATLQDDQRQAALFQAFDVQKVLVSGNVVVYAPYEKAEIAHIMQAMVNAFLRDMGLEGQLFLSPTLTTFMKEKLVLEQMAISKDDLCSGASSLWSASKEKSCEPFQVVQDGAASIRQMVQQYLERPVLEVLEAMLEHEQSIEKNREIHMKSILHSRTVSNLQYNKNVHLVVGLVPMDMEADSDAERGFTFRICKIPPMPIDARYEHSPLVADTTMRARVQESMDQCPGDQITDYAGLQLFYYDV
ncbi:hypothetical protein SARC_05978 [Sphaeroforma arctica JP610]|uniref:Uncharacterized protein n=1 Tax=Sphaeroforma arctica JP610 TaxID=667725 RepID=A0A0L0FYS1_9EUKA|nr:hypothetical protein SARC_05978 [Sphaeroforma arctica JP610]KNC81706.1 hypothetical protein SARC_05978 [Sphaeroforma arctica JP610]|eukprot:XP_014155608.1 hypothetical protein SARC_05978 [Sphaeroforma arctica JP610]